MPESGLSTNVNNVFYKESLKLRILHKAREKDTAESKPIKTSYHFMTKKAYNLIPQAHGFSLIIGVIIRIRWCFSIKNGTTVSTSK